MRPVTVSVTDAVPICEKTELDTNTDGIDIVNASVVSLLIKDSDVIGGSWVVSVLIK